MCIRKEVDPPEEDSGKPVPSGDGCGVDFVVCREVLLEACACRWNGMVKHLCW